VPAYPEFIHRVKDGVAALEGVKSDWVDRRMLQEALGVGKWTAWRILRRCGATDGPGNTLVCRRDELIARLRRLEQDRRFEPELQRRRKVETYLDGMARFVAQRHRSIAREERAEALVSSRFAALPAGVELTGSELRIQFAGTEDFLQKFGAVVFALHNDYDAVTAFLESRRE
jgi:hypothetical protein